MLTKESVENVAKLARLKLSEEEISDAREQLSAVLQSFEQIAKIDTDGIAPLITPTEMASTLREDNPKPNASHPGADTLLVDKILESAPEKSGRLFRVPPVV